MAVTRLYSALDLAGLPIQGLPVGLAGAPDAAVSVAQLRQALDELEARIPRLHVGPTDPGFTGPGLWVQTGLGPDGNGVTLWIEDGKVAP